MIYPRNLETRIPEIREIVSSWPVKKDIDDVLAWILQFDSIDIDLAIKVIQNLNVIGQDELNNALAIAYSKLQRHANEKGHKVTLDNTLYVTFGSAAKSGSLIAYNFRCINGLSSATFLNEASIEMIKNGSFSNLVLIDDIIGSGGQSSELVKKTAEKAHSLGIQDIYVLTAIGFREGIEKIRTTQVAEVFAAIEYEKIDTVASLDSLFYEGIDYERRVHTKDKLENKYLGLGHKDMGALIVFYYNTPNNTIKCVWCNQDGWIPLFERKSDSFTSGPELYTIEELLDNKEIVVESQNKPKCNIYVEGKLEELFLQELANQCDNFGFGEVNVISVGPFYSEQLINTLAGIAEKVFFVTTESVDSETQHAKNIKEAMGGKILTRISDVLKYFNTDKIKSTDPFSYIIDWELIDEAEDEDLKLRLIEGKLFRKAVSAYRFSNMKGLIQSCLKDGKLEELKSLFTAK